MVAADQVQHRKYRGTGSGRGEGLDVRQWIPVINGGDFDGRMMPMASILLNSDLAASSLSPISRRARAKTGAPDVGTVCLIP